MTTQAYLLKPKPGYLSKVEMKKVPFIGYISEIWQSLYVTREAGHDQKQKVLD